jgi:hypothetical protein
MSGDAITRRRLLMAGVSVSAAMALGRGLASAETLSVSTGGILTFYDPRFPRSQQLARALPDAGRLNTVQGDPSHLLAYIVSGGPVCHGLRLQGVTTESVPFCLGQFARDYHDVCFHSRRLNRDLFAWSLALTRANNLS